MPAVADTRASFEELINR